MCRFHSKYSNIIIFKLYRSDSFVQTDTTLSWKIRTEAYTDPKVAMLSRTKNHRYLVTMTHVEVFCHVTLSIFPVINEITILQARTARVQEWDRMTSFSCDCPWYLKVEPKYCKHIIYLLLRKFTNNQ